MLKKLALALALSLPLAAFAQTSESGSASVATLPTVSINAKGKDIREVLHEIFTQSKKNFVLDKGVDYKLYLNLENIDFDQALQIICKAAGLKIELQDGIYFVSKGVAVRAVLTAGSEPQVIVPAKPKGQLPASALMHKVTTRLEKADMKTVFATFRQQTGVNIEMEAGIPNYKLDASLVNTTLKFALERVTEAAGLKYKLTDNYSVLIYKPK